VFLIKIGRLRLDRPAIAFTLNGRETRAQIQKAKRLGARILELRIDRFPQISSKPLFQKIRSYRKMGFPLIATIRSKKEGGGRFIPDSKRIELFKTLLPWVDAVDLELASAHLTKVLVPLARRKGKQVILSYHNFRQTPPDPVLTNLLRKAKKKRANFVKIVATPKNPDDVARLLLFTERNRDQHLITISMGRLGQPTRVLAPLFGSLLTYGSLGRPEAPGQLSISRLSKEIKIFS